MYLIKKIVKKDVYDELVKIVNSIDTSKLVKKTDHNAGIKVIEDKIPSTNNLATNASLTQLAILLLLKIKYLVLVI